MIKWRRAYAERGLAGLGDAPRSGRPREITPEQRSTIWFVSQFSAVVSDALAGWVRGQPVDAWLAVHQEAHGTFDEDELRALAEDAGVPYVPAGRSRRPA